jgi:hypothetical protein
MMNGSGHYQPDSSTPAHDEPDYMPLQDVAAQALKGFGLTANEGNVWNPDLCEISDVAL